MSRRFILIMMILLSTSFYFMPQPKARAIDPVTLAILTPIAIKGAQILAPYVLRGLQNMGIVFLRSLKHLISVFKIPLGVLESTVGALWFFRSGVVHIAQGFWGICCFAGNILILPVAAFGIGV